MGEKSIAERAAEGLPVTRAEAAEQIRSSGKRWCRGLPIHTPEEMAALKAEYDSATSLQQRIALKVRLEQKYSLAHKDVRTEDEVHARIMPLIYAYPDTVGNHRATCAQDINELVIADGKFDGELHTIECPRCHQPQHYRVLFNLSD